MKDKLEALKQQYITMREQSRAMKQYVKDSDDIIKLDAGIVTFDLVIEDLEKLLKDCAIFGVSVSLPSDEEIREPIQNALYSTDRFMTHECTELSDGILTYLNEAGYKVVRVEVNCANCRHVTRVDARTPCPSCQNFDMFNN